MANIISLSVSKFINRETIQGTIRRIKMLSKGYFILIFLLCAQFAIAQPNTIANLELWLRADSSIIGGPLVSQWGDISGNANHATQGVPATQPTLVADGGAYLNNHPVIQFTTSRLTLPNFMTTGLATAFTVYQVNDTLGGVAGFSVIISFLNGIEIYPIASAGYPSPCFIGQSGGGSAKAFLGINEKDTMPHALTVGYNGGDVAQDSSYSGGYNFQSETILGIGPFGGRTGSTIGDRDAAGFYFKGDIAEIIIYDTVLTASQRQNVENYLRTRYTPPVSLDPDINVGYGFCDTTLDAGNRFTSYLWSTGATTQTIAVNNSGSYSVTVTDVFGFSSSDTINVSYPGNINAFPDTMICLGDSLIWNTQLDTAFYNILWKDLSTDSFFVINDTGQFYVTVTDSNACVVNSDSLIVTVDTFALFASLGPDDTLCSGNSITLVIGAAQAVSYAWSTSDTTPTTQVDSGTYWLNVTDSLGCTATDTIEIENKGQAPVANFNLSFVCLGDTVLFVDSSFSLDTSTIVSWSWNFGDGFTSIVQNPSHLYDSAAAFNVTLTALTSAGCLSVYSDSVQIYSQPVATATILSSPICSGVSTDFMDMSTIFYGNILTRKWFYGDGDSSTLANPSHTYLSAGEYYITLVAGNNLGCVDTAYAFVKAFGTGCGNPQAMGGLNLWLRADSFITGGPLVSQWGDISGNSNNATQGIPANQPTFIADGGDELYNHSVIEFTTSRLTLPNFMSTGLATAYMVYRVNDTLGGSGGFSVILSLLNGVEVFPIAAGGYPSPCFIGKTGGSSAMSFAGIDQKDTLPHALTIAYDGGDVTKDTSYFGDYDLQSIPIQAASPLGGRVGSTIGDRDSDGFYFKGDIAEILIYDTILTVLEQQNVKDYLHYRYAPPVNLGPDISVGYGFCPTILNGEKRFKSYMWSTGETSQTISINTSGSYSVTVTDIFGFTSFDTIKVTYPGSLSPFPDTTICVGDSLTWNTQLDTSYYSIQWHDLSIDSLYVINDTGQYFLTITDSNFCLTVSDTLTVLMDTFNLLVSLGPDDTLCSGNTIGLKVGAAQTVSYLWSTGATTVTTLVDSGLYWVMVTDSLGCIGNDTMIIYKKGQAPIANFNFVAACYGDSMTFTDSSYSLDTSSVVSRLWDFGDSSTASSQNPLHQYSSTGQFGVTLTVTTSVGCQGTFIDSTQVYSIPSASAHLLSTLVCSGVSISFQDSSSISYGNLITRLWNFGDSDTSSLANPSHTYGSSGEYNVRLVVGNDIGCTDTAYAFAKVFNTGCGNPQSLSGLQLWVRSDSAVVGSPLVSQWGDISGNSNHAFQAISTKQPVFVADGGDDLYNHPVLRFTTSRFALPNFMSTGRATAFIVYRVNDTLGGGAGFSTLVSLLNGIEIYALASGAYTSPCFIGQTGGSSGKGFNGINQKDTVPHALMIAYNGGDVSEDSSYTGSYNLQSQLIVATSVFGARVGSTIGDKDSGGLYFKGDMAEIIIYDTTLSAQQNQEVEDYLHYRYAPPVNLGPDINVGYGFCPTSLDAASRFISYAWSTGNAADTNQILVVSKTGTYSVTVTDIFGFISVDTVQINYPGDLGSLRDSTICLDSSLVLETKLDTSIYSLMWQDSSTSSIFNVTQQGVYSISVSDSLGCIANVDSVTILVDSFQVTMMLDPDDTVCAGFPVILVEGATEAAIYLWDNGATTTSRIADIDGTYWVQVTDTNGCMATDSVIKTVIGIAPTAAFSYTPTCLGDSTSFADLTDTSSSGAVAIWTWSFGDGNGDTLQNTSHLYDSAGAFVVTLISTTADGCSGSFSDTIRVRGLPAAGFSPTQGCSKLITSMVDQSTITADTIVSWLWVFDSLGTDTLANSTFTYPDTGAYNVTLVASSNFGCIDSITQTVSIKETPDIGFEYTLSCGSNTVVFNDTSIISTPGSPWYTWTFGDGSTEATTDPVSHTYLNPGIYNVTLSVQSTNGCLATMSDSITVAPIILNVDFTGVDPCINEPNTFQDGSSASGDSILLWNWKMSPFPNSTVQNPTVTYSDSGTFSVTLIATTAGECVDSITKTITVHSSPSVDFSFNPQFGVNQSEPVQFTNLSISCVSYIWNFGDSTALDTAVNPAHQYIDTGVYQVTLLGLSAYNCADSLTQNVDVRQATVDVEVLSVNADCLPSIIENITVTLVNRGTREITSLDLFMQVDGREAIREQWTGFIAPSNIETYTFSVAYPLSSSETISYLCVWVEKPNGVTDEVFSNNKKCVACDNSFAIIDLFPNPATDMINAWFILPQAEFIMGNLYDERGALIGEAFSGTGVKGLNQVEINTFGLRHGIYTLKIEYLGTSYVRTFVVH